jgi:His-Xaa-Ser system radical SAM maturase HxsC
MLKLREKIGSQWDAERFITRITTNPSRPLPIREHEALLLKAGGDKCPSGFRAYFALASELAAAGVHAPEGQRPVELPCALSYLADGDVVAVDPRHGDIAVLYRKCSPFNSLLVTERCNNDCLMCSQPPRKADDHFRVRELLEIIPLIDVNTKSLVITGGEPTLLVDDLLKVVVACRNFLPCTALLVLSNGRFFSYLSYCRALAEIKHPDLMFAVPLYSDLPSQHDFVVQADGAFDQTLRGIMNLGRWGHKVEIRTVIHKLNVERLAAFTQFIVRNLPFVHHVALMGLEIVGHAKANLEALWVDPGEYRAALGQAVSELSLHRIPVSIYNHPLCMLDGEYWPYARQSISDWKNMFLDVCACCAARNRCCGFFSSSMVVHSAHVKPIEDSELLPNAPCFGE